MLLMSKACCSLRRRLCRGALGVVGVKLEAPFELLSESGEGTGDSVRKLQSLDKRSRLTFFAVSELGRRFFSGFFFVSAKENQSKNTLPAQINDINLLDTEPSFFVFSIELPETIFSGLKALFFFLQK